MRVLMVLCLSTMIWTGSASGQDRPDPNELVQVRRGDIAKCRAMAEQWEEKSRVCDAADADARRAEEALLRAEARLEAAIRAEERAKIQAERNGWLAIAGAGTSVVLVILIFAAPR